MKVPLASLGDHLRTLSLAVTAVAVCALGYGLASDDSTASRLYRRYVAHLNAMFRLLFRKERGEAVAKVQIAVIFAFVAASLAFGLPHAEVYLLLSAFLPLAYLHRDRTARIQQLEQQVDGFVLAFANALKTVPSPAAALAATAATLQEPTRQEIQQVLKEMRVGSTLEQALVAMSSRVKSPWLDVAFSAVLIGLRVGGNLPVVLERTAATIREMNRLHGVVRTKTGEGRMQLWVLALFPVAIAGGLTMVKPDYFDPMRDSVVGQVTLAVAAILWLSSLLVARKILTVDI